MKKAFHICIEGTEGCFKTTNTKAVADYFTNEGFKVLATKEPGTSHIPLTMTLRGIMLDKQYDDVITQEARELISQAIRSIHVKRLLRPAMTEYDYIVQDRGIASGIAYGLACGNDPADLSNLLQFIYNGNVEHYDLIVFLESDSSIGLKNALESKQEFEGGDAMEARGDAFMQEVEMYFYGLLKSLSNVVFVNTVNKSREDILSEIVNEVLNKQKQDE